MSVILGVHRQDRNTVQELRLRSLAAATERYAPDRTEIVHASRTAMAFQLFATSLDREHGGEAVLAFEGDLLAFDGRLDNKAELAGLLGLRVGQASNSKIVLTAFARWGETSFSHLIGDWALALWSHRTDSLYLACDHAGTRTIFYEVNDQEILWSTYLETFFVEGRSRPMSRMFASGYLRAEPMRFLTPYDGIEQVPAAHYVQFREGKRETFRHWECLIDDRIRYSSDLDYERHFLHLLRQSVARRSNSGDRVIAHLSGGMDSSTIVAVSDLLRRESGAQASALVDTVSLIDPSEPSWNELPYIRAVECWRGKAGTHIEASYLNRDCLLPQTRYHYPGADASVLAGELEFEECLGSGKYRAVLSGIGGDELLGGPPNPLPELGDYLVARQCRELQQQSMAWCLSQRLSLWHLMPAVCRFVRNPTAAYQAIDAPPWLHLDRHLTAESEETISRRLAGHRPSTIDRCFAWDALLDTMQHRFPATLVRYEYRYPLLDRDLVDFLLRVPPSQIQRPGERRSLMKRTLASILPPEILGRTLKASLKRGPLLLFERRRQEIERLFEGSYLEQLGYLSSRRLVAAINTISSPESRRHRPALMRAIQLEIWLRAEAAATACDPSQLTGSIAVG